MCLCSLSLSLSLSLLTVNLLGRLPCLLIGSGSCQSSLINVTPTYPVPVKFPPADKRTCKEVNKDFFCFLGFAVMLLVSWFDLFLYVKFQFVCFAIFLLNLTSFLICYFVCFSHFVTRMALLFELC